MENNEIITSELKTPRRTRRTSVLESQKTPSVDMEGKKDPVTPGRRTRTMDPSRSETPLAGMQTPRRSCRKSIKPIQEYENIVAQKGLSAKRLLLDPTPEVLEEASLVADMRENKWTAADIGRASTKRSKKKRTKSKRLERQQNVVEQEESVEKDQIFKLEEDLEARNELDDKHEDVDDVSSEKAVKKNKDCVAKKEEESIEIPPTDEPASAIQIECDDSMEEEGDVILSEMPITADDCMQSPEKPLDNDVKTSATPFVESANQSDDSDCIMLSLNDSSQSRQSICQTGSSVVDHESKVMANISSDSTANSMPPLVCSDDEDDVYVDAVKSPEVATKVNGTFTTEDNLEEQIDDSDICSKINPVLDPKEIMKIVVGVEEEESVSMITSAPDDGQISPMNETFDADKSPVNQRKTQSSRTQTPFKSDKTIIPDIIIDSEEEFKEPLQIVDDAGENPLKSSRKRSFSFCVDRPKKIVTFHSPSNTTIQICHEDLVNNTTKQNAINITKRHKRSLSVTETDRDLIDYMEMKRPNNETPKKKAHQSKIKMPNFSNIHQKHFQRMESITDHVARRAERAKNLINSSTKLNPASLQKGFLSKNSVLRDSNKTHLPRPKARQRIDMSSFVTKPKAEVTNTLLTATKSKQDLQFSGAKPQPQARQKIDISSFDTKPKAEVTNTLLTATKSKQDLQFLGDMPQPLVGKTPTKVSTNNSTKQPPSEGVFKFSSTIMPSTPVPKRLHLPNPREKFNLSTTISQPINKDKLEERRNRMMEMFKSKTSHKAVQSNREILKGVRTNRRFELQMMCRNQKK